MSFDITSEWDRYYDDQEKNEMAKVVDQVVEAIAELGYDIQVTKSDDETIHFLCGPFILQASWKYNDDFDLDITATAKEIQQAIEHL